MNTEKLKELISMLKGHNVVTFTLTGIGETILETSYFEDAIEELQEISNLLEIAKEKVTK